MSEVTTRQAKSYWHPGETQSWPEPGLLIEQRQGYFLHDVDGNRLIDIDLNGGVFNLGHRNPELVETLTMATRRVDVGDHRLPSLAATTLAEALTAATPGDLQYTVCSAGSTELIGIALATARQSKPAGKMLCTSSGAGEHDVDVVPYNDLGAMEDAMARAAVAAVLIQTMPQSAGFLLPDEGYLQGVKALCERYSALYIADETNIGLMHTGQLWAINGYGVQPDILLVGNGISGGMYPFACGVFSTKPLVIPGNRQSSGSEPGCLLALKSLEICQRTEVQDLARHISEFIGSGLAAVQRLYPDFVRSFVQHGLVMGLEFAGDDSAQGVMQHLYQHGVWVSAASPTLVQIKPGTLMSQALAEELLVRVETAIFAARQEQSSHNRNRAR